MEIEFFPIYSCFFVFFCCHILFHVGLPRHSLLSTTLIFWMETLSSDVKNFRFVLMLPPTSKIMNIFFFYFFLFAFALFERRIYPGFQCSLAHQLWPTMVFPFDRMMILGKLHLHRTNQLNYVDGNSFWALHYADHRLFGFSSPKCNNVWVKHYTIVTDGQINGN